MCHKRERKNDPPEPDDLPPSMTDEQAKALIGIARRAAIDQMAEPVRRVLDAALIDDRAERVQAIAAVCVRYDIEQQHCLTN